MTMNDIFLLTASLFEGAVLGLIFFGGLWWTVQKAVTAKNVALLFFGSMVLRMSIVLLGFYYILGDNWQRLIAGLIGLIIARLVVTRLTRVYEQAESLLKKAEHAPES